MTDPAAINADMDLAAFWGIKHRRLRGNPYGFINYKNPHQHRPFLLFPLMVQPQNKGYKKSRQAGVSENSVTESLFLLDQNRINIVYCFPSPKQVEDFSNTRVKAAIQDSVDGYIDAMQGEIRNVGLRTLGQGHLYMRATTSPNLGESVDADVVVFDEVDRMPRNIKIVFRETLSSSKFGYIRELSTPTLPGRGIDEFWQRSTQHHWYVTCPACGKSQTLRYPENIIQLKDDPPYEKIVQPGTYDFCCSNPRCKSRKINRWDGKWQPHQSGRRDHWCFHINQLMCVWITADQIMQKKKDYKFPQLFWNYVLGETYASDNVLLNEHHLDACTSSEISNIGRRTSRYTKYAVGIDWGNLNWAAVYGRREDGLIDLVSLVCAEDTKEPLESTRKIIERIKPFDPDIIVADLGYGKDRVAEVKKHFPGRTFGCTYADNSKSINPKFTEDFGSVTVDRTAWLKGTAHMFRDMKVRIPVPDRAPLLPVFYKHMTCSVVMLEETDNGEIKERVEETDDDHFFHCSGYAFMGFEWFGGESRFDFSF